MFKFEYTSSHKLFNYTRVNSKANVMLK